MDLYEDNDNSTISDSDYGGSSFMNTTLTDNNDNVSTTTESDYGLRNLFIGSSSTLDENGNDTTTSSTTSDTEFGDFGLRRLFDSTISYDSSSDTASELDEVAFARNLGYYLHYMTGFVKRPMGRNDDDSESYDDDDCVYSDGYEKSEGNNDEDEDYEMHENPIDGFKSVPVGFVGSSNNVDVYMVADSSTEEEDVEYVEDEFCVAADSDDDDD